MVLIIFVVFVLLIIIFLVLVVMFLIVICNGRKGDRCHYQ
jgi:hypothetical protein